MFQIWEIIDRNIPTHDKLDKIKPIAQKLITNQQNGEFDSATVNEKLVDINFDILSQKSNLEQFSGIL